MKNKQFLVFCTALLALVLSLNLVNAELADITNVKVNGISADSDSVSIAETVSDTVPVEVEFVANEDATNARVEVYIEGYKNVISDTTDLFQMVEGTKYIKRLKLTLPSSMDLDDNDEDLELHVRISAKGEDSVDEPYDVVLNMQKQIYNLNILSMNLDRNTVIAGNTVPLSVVLKNSGYNRLNNVYVKASIPELDIERTIYVGDLSSYEEDDYGELRDTVEGRIYLDIPKNAIPGIYKINVEAYNYYTSVADKKILNIVDSDTGILPLTNNADSNKGTSNSFVIGLTIVLAIVFVVLLVALIVLLTKKPTSETEEFGETNYY